MSEIENRAYKVVSRFVSEWLGSREAQQLRSLPSISRARLLSSVPPGEWTEGLLAGKPKELVDSLLGLLSNALREESAEARVAWLVHDLMIAGDEASKGECVSSFVSALLKPTQQVLHSFTLVAFEVEGIAPGQCLPLVNGWQLHQRGMPLDTRARRHVAWLGLSEHPFSLTRFADVPKGSDPQMIRIAGMLEALSILDGLRLFAQSGCFFVQEDFSPDYHYVTPDEFVPAPLPKSPARRVIAASRWGQVRAFTDLWLRLTPALEAESKSNKMRNRLRQALGFLRDGYSAGNWQQSVLNAVSGLELLLVHEIDELSFRLSIRAAYLLSAMEPQKAGDIFTRMREIYQIRSSLAHGDWYKAAGQAARAWPEAANSAGGPGCACANFALELLRKAVLTQAYFGSKPNVAGELPNEPILLNPAERDRLRDSMLADTANPLIRALTIGDVD